MDDNVEEILLSFSDLFQANDFVEVTTANSSERLII